MKKILTIILLLALVTSVHAQQNYRSVKDQRNKRTIMLQRQARIDAAKKRFEQQRQERIQLNRDTARARFAQRQSRLGRRGPIYVTYTRPTQGHFNYWDLADQEWDYSETRRYKYDSLARNTQLSYHDSSINDTNYFIQYAYNENGRLTSSRSFFKGPNNQFRVLEIDSVVYHPIHHDYVTENLYYFYDFGQDSLLLVSGDRYVFTTNNDLITSRSEQIFNGMNWDNVFYEEFSYDNQNRLIGKDMYAVSGLVYDTLSRMEFSFTGSQPYPSMAIEYDWRNDLGQYVPETKFDSVTFLNFTKSFADYELFSDNFMKDAEMNQLVLSTYDESTQTWELDFKQSYTWESNFNQSVALLWNGNNWVPFYRQSEFTDSAYVARLMEDYVGNSWVASIRDTIFTNKFGQNLGESYEFFSDSEQKWIISWRTITTEFYNSEEELVQTITQFWDASINQMRNIYLEYFDFWQLFVEEIEDNTSVNKIKEYNFNIYPVPFSDYLTIDYDGNGPFEVYVYDMSGKGKKILNERADFTTTLNLSDLKPGVYILVCRGLQNYPVTFKVIKQ
jgi:hypothetical protein